MSFSKKAAQIIHTLQTDYGQFKIPANKKQSQPDRQPVKPCKHRCSAVQVNITSGSGPNSKKITRQNLILQTPIIIDTKHHAKSVSVHKNFPQRKVSNLKNVEAFVPIALPSREKKMYRMQATTTQNTPKNKEIQIFINDDGQDKQCLKKLFKKIHTLTQHLAESEKERVRLQLQLDHLSRKDFSCKDHQKTINKLEGQKYRLEMEVQNFKKRIKQNDKMIPKQTIKQFVVEKPVEVKVQIPRYILGPERIVQKIVEVPKYIQIQKKIPEIIVKQIKVPEIVQKQVFVERPVYKDPIIVDKPVYIQKPVYVDRPVEVEKKVEVQVPVQIEVPIYIDRPIIDEQWIRRFQDLQDQLGVLMKENQTFKSENHNLKMTVKKLQVNLDLMNNHNRQKNREVQLLLNNRGDYLPPHQEMKVERKSALDRTTSTLSPRSHHHLRYL